VLKRILTGALMAMVLATGSILAGQDTGGDKGRRTRTAAAPGLNPQPLPPGRHRYRRYHRRHRRHPNAITVKQK